MLWILKFDDENNKLADKLWKKYNMTLRNASFELREEESGKNIFYYMRSQNTNIFESSIRSMVEAIKMNPDRFDLIIEDLIEFYDKEMSIIEAMSVQSLNSQHQVVVTDASKKIAADERTNRIAISEILKRSADLIRADSLKKVFEFLVTKGCLDQNEKVA